MKLKILYYLRFVFCILILFFPIIRDFATSGGFKFNPAIDIYALVCAVGILVCHKAYKCPSCKKHLGYRLVKVCPHCNKSL